MNEKVDIEIFKRRLVVEMEGLTPFEINALAQQIQEKMAEVARRNAKIADSSKLAILTALEIAAELHQLRAQRETDVRVLENKVDQLTLALQSALGKR